MAVFEIGERDFLLDGRPHRVMAGSLHYFRVHPTDWADRIRKARLMGLNTIETYVPWNAHAPSPGEFLTTGQLDLVGFLELVAAEGMHAILRPGPYICAEWDNGGLPGWLFADARVGIRRSEPVFLTAVEAYLRQLLALTAPLQVDRGGPIILMQVENEYGAYGSDKTYLRELLRIFRGSGITVPLTSIDQPTDEMLENGSIPGLHKTASFGSRSTARLAKLREHQPTGPLMCAEYWDGWFDHWGAHHHVTSAEQTESDFRDLMATGASFCLYMFTGGTNFGFTNGANDKGTYQPTVTSYDYDAPLTEDGRTTPKFDALRRVIGEFESVPELTAPENNLHAVEPSPEFEVVLDRSVSLWNAVSAAEIAEVVETSGHTPTADELGQYGGFTLYRAGLPTAGLLAIAEVRDRASVFVDGAAVGVLSRALSEHVLSIPAGSRLEILVEDQGRVNYGPRIGEPKGLIGPVSIDGVAIESWQTVSLTACVLGRLASDIRGPIGAIAGPLFVAGSFDLPAAADLHLGTAGWGKGVAWINGFCLGRYWSAGPQRSLFVPSGVVRAGRNELVLFELHGSTSPVVRFVPAADLGSTDF